MRRSQTLAKQTTVTRKPAAATRALSESRRQQTPRATPASNHHLAGQPTDVAGIVEHARGGPATSLPNVDAVAREFGLPRASLEIHADTAARDACLWLGAKAFAVNNLVVFGESAPSITQIRHELAHVIQQGGATRHAPEHFRPGSLTVGSSGTAAEADAARVALGDSPKKADASLDPVVQCDADPTDLRRALARLKNLAAISKIQKFKPDDENNAPVFGISQGKDGDKEKFDPLFVVSSAATWRLADYRTAASPALSESDAGADLRDLIFKRPEDDKTKLVPEAIANTSIRVGNMYVWACRVVVPTEPDTDGGDTPLAVRKTKSYAFIGTYQSKDAQTQVRKDEENKFPLVNRTSPRRKEPDPADSIEGCATIFENIKKEAKKDGRSLKGIGKSDTLPQAIKTARDVVAKSKSADGPGKSELEDQAKAVRDALKDWVLDNFTTIDEFYDEIIASDAFPPEYNAIKGDIFVKFIADNKGGNLVVGTEQIYFGKRSAGGKVTKRANLRKLRRADGYLEKKGEFHLLESKARTDKPNADELDQMDDYLTIIIEEIRGFLLKSGKIDESEKFDNFSAVEYYVGNDKQVAAKWNDELKSRFGKKGRPKAYSIYPPQKAAEKTWIRFNPTAELPIPNPEQVEQSVTNVANVPKGTKILKADFKLARPLEPDIESGTLSVAVDMGGVIQSPETPGTKPLKPTVDTDAKPEKPGGPIIYGRVENKFEKLGSSIDKFFKERVTTDAKLTPDGVAAWLRISAGPSGIPNILLDEAVISATYGARGLAAKGKLGLSNKKGTVKGGLDVTWTSAAKQWKITGDVTFTDLIDGLEPIKAKFTYDPEHDEKKIHADRVAIKKTYGGVTLKGLATNLEYDINAGAFSGTANLAATLGAFGEASAENITIEGNQIKNATLAYKSPTLSYPKTNPVLKGDLRGSITYTAGKTPDDKPSFSGEIDVNAQIHAAALKRLSKNSTLSVTGSVKVSDEGKFSGSIGTTDELTLGQHFRIPPFQANIAANGALSLDFSIEVVDIGPLKDAKVDALINEKGFSIKGANIQLKFGTDKDKVWGTLGVLYTPPNLTVGGTINVRIKEGLVAHGEAYYDTQRETVSATLSIDEITLLKYGPKQHTLVDFSKQVELVSFYKVIGIYLDIGFNLTFSYEFDLRLNPKVTLEDFSFKTFNFARARAVMKLLGQMAATLTGTPNIGLGLFVISTKLLRGGGGIEVPIAGRAALQLEPPVTIEVVYTPDGGISAGGTAGLTLLFGVTGAVKPYADFSVLDGTYEHKWHGEPLVSFELLKERPIFTYVVNFGKPLTTETKPPIPEGQQEPPKQVNAERSVVGKPKGQGTAAAVKTDTPAQEKDPEEKPEAKSEGGFDLKGMVSRLLDDPSFASARRILDAAGKVWATISGIVGAIVNFVRNWIGGAIDLIVGAIRAIGDKNLMGFVKELLKKHMHPILFHIVEPLLDQLGKIEQDLYDLFEVKLPTSPGGYLEFAVGMIKKVLKLAWDSLPGLVKAIYKMISNAIDAARDFCQYLVNEGKLGVTREERYIGSETLGIEHDFLLANEYKIRFGGMNVHEKDDSAWPSADKAIGWGLWHLLDELGVQPTNTAINKDTGDPYNDYWVERKIRGSGAIASNAAGAIATAARSSGSRLPPALRQRYETGLGADLSDIRVHTGREPAAAAKAIDARAFTIGRNIYFDSGEFSPETPEGASLLAHELAHAKSHTHFAERQHHGLQIASPSSQSEQMAEKAARRFSTSSNERQSTKQWNRQLQ